MNVSWVVCVVFAQARACVFMCAHVRVCVRLCALSCHATWSLSANALHSISVYFVGARVCVSVFNASLDSLHQTVQTLRQWLRQSHCCTEEFERQQRKV